LARGYDPTLGVAEKRTDARTLIGTLQAVMHNSVELASQGIQALAVVIVVVSITFGSRAFFCI
jgi:hypothetical protein